MDCPSEEQMIRMKVQHLSEIKQLQFNIPDRKLNVFHEGDSAGIATALSELKLDSRHIETTQIQDFAPQISESLETRVLVTVLLINFILFLIEMTTGLISKSMGLVADSLDMLADSIVYALSLYAVGHAVSRKKQIAKIAGYFQFLLALIGFSEVIRRFLGFEEMPVFQTMIIVSIIALTGNIACLFILQKAKDTGAHMKASWIFTSNDIIVNFGVILAGILVYYTSSNKPDLIIGSIVFVLVARGAYRIYRLSK
jgi:Co/Zn/Cd efflux system component